MDISFSEFNANLLTIREAKLWEFKYTAGKPTCSTSTHFHADIDARMRRFVDHITSVQPDARNIIFLASIDHQINQCPKSTRIWHFTKWNHSSSKLLFFIFIFLTFIQISLQTSEFDFLLLKSFSLIIRICEDSLFYKSTITVLFFLTLKHYKLTWSKLMFDTRFYIRLF